MGLFSVKNLKGALQGAVDSAATAVREGKIAEQMNELVENATSAVKESNLTEQVGNLVETATTAVKEGRVAEQVNDLIKSASGEANSSISEGVQVIDVPVTDAVRIFYYLMSADGTLQSGELDEFNAIYNDLCPSVANEKEAIIKECKTKLEENASTINPLISVMACVDTVLYSPSAIEGDGLAITPKLLIWDTLAIAYSDDACDATEREVIAHIAKHFGLGDALIPEMESAILTLADIEREEAWVKTTNRPYLTIEAIVNELELRKAAVLEDIKTLIEL